MMGIKNTIPFSKIVFNFVYIIIGKLLYISEFTSLMAIMITKLRYIGD